MSFSQATPSAPSVSAVWRMVAQSDWLPMMMAIGAGRSLILRNRIQKEGSDYKIGPLFGKVSRGATMDYPELVRTRKRVRMSNPLQCPGSDIRIISQRVRLRMSEPKGH